MPHTPLLPPTGALELLEEKTIWKTAFSFSLAPLNANQRRRLKIPSKAGVRTADRENGGAERLQLPGRKRDWRRRAFLENPLPDFPAPRLRFQPLLQKATPGAPRGVAGPPSAGAAGGITPKLASTPVLRALPDGTSRGYRRGYSSLEPRRPRGAIPQGFTGGARNKEGCWGPPPPRARRTCAGQRGVEGSVRSLHQSRRHTATRSQGCTAARRPPGERKS